MSTILIRLTGWAVFDPLASLFIAALIMASVIPLVIDSAKVLCLDVGAETEAQIRAALSEVRFLSQIFAGRVDMGVVGVSRGALKLLGAPVLADVRRRSEWLDPYPARSDPW